MASQFQPIEELLRVEGDARDAEWEKRFLQALTGEKLKIVYPDPKPGPDGWPYLFVETGPDADEPALKVVDWLATRGIGMAVNPSAGAPDFVLSYGMLWNYKERGAFLSEAKTMASGSFNLKPGQQVLTGEPSESYLPPYARLILKQFFMDQGVFGPKVMLVSQDGGGHYDLCFSLESLGTPPPEEHAGIAEAISWFLPAHYSVALLSEKAVSGFKPL